MLVPPLTTFLPPWDGYLAASRCPPPWSLPTLSLHLPMLLPSAQVGSQVTQARDSGGRPSFCHHSLLPVGAWAQVGTLGGSGLCLRADQGGRCPHPGRREPLAYLQSRDQTLPRVKAAISLVTPVLSELGLWAWGKRRLVSMTLWWLVGGYPGSWWATLPGNRVPKHLGVFIVTLQVPPCLKECDIRQQIKSQQNREIDPIFSFVLFVYIKAIDFCILVYTYHFWRKIPSSLSSKNSHNFPRKISIPKQKKITMYTPRSKVPAAKTSRQRRLYKQTKIFQNQHKRANYGMKNSKDSQADTEIIRYYIE